MHSILDLFEDGASCTPDFISLNKSDNKEFLLFVYDDMKQGCANHGILENSIYYGRGTTVNQTFVMRDTWKTSVIFRMTAGRDYDGNVVPNHYLSRIHGELYGVSLRTISDIDYLLLNRSVMTRTEEWITPLDGENTQLYSLKAYTYIGEPKYFGTFPEIQKSTDVSYDCKLKNTEGYYFGPDPRTAIEQEKDMDRYIVEAYGNMY